MHEQVIDTAVKALIDAAPAGTRVILFGSHARGLARPDSDLDFLVVEPEVKNRFEEILRLRQALGKALGTTIQPVDLMVTDTARFKKKATVPNTIAHEAATYGMVYE
jgi:predicted nucleotidyltransferase